MTSLSTRGKSRLTPEEMAALSKPAAARRLDQLRAAIHEYAEVRSAAAAEQAAAEKACDAKTGAVAEAERLIENWRKEAADAQSGLEARVKAERDDLARRAEVVVAAEAALAERKKTVDELAETVEARWRMMKAKGLI